MDNQKPQDKVEVKDDYIIKILGVAVLIVIVIITGTYWFFLRGLEISTKDPAPWGVMGDYFGGILNPVIAGCALYVLIKSFKTQQEELKATRDELAKASEAQQLQAQLTQKQLDQVDRQNFEGVLFNLLNLKKECLNLYNHNQTNGQGIFKNIIKEYISLLSNDANQSLNSFFSRFILYKTYSDHILNILEIIDKSGFDDKTKNYYVEILISTMYPAEKIMFFYVCMSQLMGINEPIIKGVKCSIITNADRKKLIDKKKLLAKYNVFEDFSDFNNIFVDKVNEWSDIELKQLDCFHKDLNNKKKFFDNFN